MIVRALVKALLWLCLRIFFHDVDSFNDSRIPESGPVIFVCAPHANQFLDPLVVTKNCKRRIGFLAAQKSCERKYVGKIIKAMDAIGVKRPQDYMKPATGKVTITGGCDLICLVLFLFYACVLSLSHTHSLSLCLSLSRLSIDFFCQGHAKH